MPNAQRCLLIAPSRHHFGSGSHFKLPTLPQRPPQPGHPSLPRQHPTSGLIWAGTVANSGLEAKAVRLSTASIRGAVAARHRSRFSSLKAPSRAWAWRRERAVSYPSLSTPHVPALRGWPCHPDAP